MNTGNRFSRSGGSLNRQLDRASRPPLVEKAHFPNQTSLKPAFPFVSTYIGVSLAAVVLLADVVTVVAVLAIPAVVLGVTVAEDDDEEDLLLAVVGATLRWLWPNEPLFSDSATEDSSSVLKEEAQTLNTRNQSSNAYVEHC
jgi:hypothetical protein